MNNIDKAQEVMKLRNRVRRLYGMGRMTLTQHNASMLLVNAMVKAATDEGYAQQILENREVFNGASGD
jgi:hypothetical protein